MNTHKETVEHAKADFVRAKERLAHALSTTPDERLAWSPSSTARTPLEQVGHAAESVEAILAMLNGQTFVFKNTAEADEAFREREQEFTAREMLLRLLEDNSAAYLQWLEALPPEALNTTVQLPFDLGALCLAEALTIAPSHFNYHAAQMNYIQTIYGDRDWHY